MIDRPWVRKPRNYKPATVARRQRSKATQEGGRPSGHKAPADCYECGEDCYRYMTCKRAVCPYRPLETDPMFYPRDADKQDYMAGTGAYAEDVEADPNE